jgi:acyl-CoA thioesterase FadM
MADDKIETVRVVTRGYELSAEGTIPVATFLRYLEHTRWSTIARSEKLPLRQFFAMGVVRAQTLELERDVSFDVALDITMWLSRVGKTSMDYSHDIVRVKDGARVGRSTATVVAIDTNPRPAPISDEARNYLTERETLSKVDLSRPAPASAWERTVELRPSDQDLQQHVNHARYADLVDDTRWLCAQAGGYGRGSEGIGGAVRRFSIVYEREARVGDAIRALTWRHEELSGVADFALVKQGDELVTRARLEFAPYGAPRHG